MNRKKKGMNPIIIIGLALLAILYFNGSLAPVGTQSIVDSGNGIQGCSDMNYCQLEVIRYDIDYGYTCEAVDDCIDGKPYLFCGDSLSESVIADFCVDSEEDYSPPPTSGSGSCDPQPGYTECLFDAETNSGGYTSYSLLQYGTSESFNLAGEDGYYLEPFFIQYLCSGLGDRIQAQVAEEPVDGGWYYGCSSKHYCYYYDVYGEKKSASQTATPLNDVLQFNAVDIENPEEGCGYTPYYCEENWCGGTQYDTDENGCPLYKQSKNYGRFTGGSSISYYTCGVVEKTNIYAQNINCKLIRPSKLSYLSESRCKNGDIYFSYCGRYASVEIEISTTNYCGGWTRDPLPCQVQLYCKSDEYSGTDINTLARDSVVVPYDKIIQCRTNSDCDIGEVCLNKKCYGTLTREALASFEGFSLQPGENKTFTLEYDLTQIDKEQNFSLIIDTYAEAPEGETLNASFSWTS